MKDKNHVVDNIENPNNNQNFRVSEIFSLHDESCYEDRVRDAQDILDMMFVERNKQKDGECHESNKNN